MRSNFDPAIFGEAFHLFVEKEVGLFGSSLAPIFHILTLIVLLLSFIYGNKTRKVFTIYFAANWLFLFGYWGGYAISYWMEIGAIYLVSFVMAPILLFMILYFWIVEVIEPKFELDFKSLPWWRYLVGIVILWGFWYPGYNYGEGFIFSAKDFIYSNYGLMPCPTTMVVLGIMTSTYPKGNRMLYSLLTAYALVIGTATVIASWLPDIPMILLGVYALILIIRNHIQQKNNLIKS